MNLIQFCMQIKNISIHIFVNEASLNTFSFKASYCPRVDQYRHIPNTCLTYAIAIQYAAVRFYVFTVDVMASLALCQSKLLSFMCATTVILYCDLSASKNALCSYTCIRQQIHMPTTCILLSEEGFVDMNVRKGLCVNINVFDWCIWIMCINISRHECSYTAASTIKNKQTIVLL